MKILKISCPGCGAHLDADESVSRVICDYCGNTISIEDSRMEGYNHEKGRFEARKSIHDDLANTVEELIEPTINIDHIKVEIKDLTSRIKSIKGYVDMYEKKTMFFVYLYPAVFSLLLVWLFYKTNAPFVLFLLGFFGCASAFILSKPLQDKKNHDDKEKIKKLTSELEEKNKLYKKYEDLLSRSRLLNIPSKYKNRKAMRFISDAIRSQQASTIEQAIAMYEDRLLREKQIELQEEQIELQKQAIQESRNSRRNETAKSAARAAGQVGGAVVAGFIIKELTKRR